jgi:hypothetical protein
MAAFFYEEYLNQKYNRELMDDETFYKYSVIIHTFFVIVSVVLAITFTNDDYVVAAMLFGFAGVVELYYYLGRNLGRYDRLKGGIYLWDIFGIMLLVGIVH